MVLFPPAPSLYSIAQTLLFQLASLNGSSCLLIHISTSFSSLDRTAADRTHPPWPVRAFRSTSTFIDRPRVPPPL